MQTRHIRICSQSCGIPGAGNRPCIGGSRQAEFTGSAGWKPARRLWRHCLLLAALEVQDRWELPIPCGHPAFGKKKLVLQSASSAMATEEDAEVETEIYLIRHAQSTMNVKPELLGGRSPWAVLTPWGLRQAQALGQALRNSGVRFDAVFASPLERAKQTCITMCQELNHPESSIEFLKCLEEVAQGEWEGRLRAEVYTPKVREIISSMQLDFHAPGGESQRQAEFRMVDFMLNVVTPRAVKAARSTGSSDELQVLPARGLDTGVGSSCSGEDQGCIAASESSVQEVVMSDGCVTPLSVVIEAELLKSVDVPVRSRRFCVAAVTHGHAMKCLLRGLLGSSPHMTRRFTIDNASVTVIRHSTITGWQIIKVNDTSHLRSLQDSRVGKGS